MSTIPNMQQWLSVATKEQVHYVSVRGSNVIQMLPEKWVTHSIII